MRAATVDFLNYHKNENESLSYQIWIFVGFAQKEPVREFDF